MVVGRLEERLLLRRAIDPTDKRKRLLELTPGTYTGKAADLARKV